MKLTVLSSNEENKVFNFKFAENAFVEEPLVQVTVIPSIGDFIKCEEPLVTIETCARLFSIRAPIEGMITSLNSDLFHMMDKFNFEDWVVSIRKVNYEEYTKMKSKEPAKRAKKYTNLDYISQVSIPSPEPVRIIDDVPQRPFAHAPEITAEQLERLRNEWMTMFSLRQEWDAPTFNSLLSTPNRRNRI